MDLQQPLRRDFWRNLKRVAAEELEPLLSRRVLAQLAMYLPTQAFSRARTAMLRQAGVQIEAKAQVQGPLLVTGAGENPCAQISIGTSTLISGYLHCDVGAPIRIGNSVRIGHGVSLLTVDHDIGTKDLRSGIRKYGPIEIGDGAWLASHVVVLPGVRIGAGAIVAAGSVVTHDVPDNTLVRGVPARVARELDANAQLASDHHEPGPSSRRFLRQSRSALR